MTDEPRIAIIAGTRITAILLDDVEGDLAAEIAKVKAEVEAAGLDPDLIDLVASESRELLGEELRKALRPDPIPYAPDLGRSIFIDPEPREVDHRHRNRPNNGHPRSYRRGRK